MVRKSIISSIVVFAIAILMTGTGVAQEWVARYDGSVNLRDWARAIAVDADGNVYVTGSSDVFNDPYFADYSTVSYDRDGNERWVQRYDGSVNLRDWATAIAVDGDGNVYVTGGSYGDGTSSDYCTISYDSNGNERWVKRYDGPAYSDDSARAIVVDGDGNVYVTGGSYGDGTSSDYCTISYDSNGNERWVKRYDGPAYSDDSARAIVVDGDDNIYITGNSYYYGTWDYCTISYDRDGNERWVQRYDGDANHMDFARAIAVDADGNVYITGGSYGDGTSSDYCTISYDSNGNERWVKRYDGPAYSDDDAFAIVVDDVGNVYVSGYIRFKISGFNRHEDYCTVSYDRDGNERWVKRYDGSGNDRAFAIGLDNSGNLYVTGESSVDGTLDYCTISYDSDGNERWVQRYNGPGNNWDSAAAIAVDNNGNVYVTGKSLGYLTGYDFCTIKYASDPVTSLLRKAIDTLEDLDDDDFKSGLLREMLSMRINSALSQYDKGFTNIALIQLKDKVIKKMDGCAKRGEPDAGFTLYENDWMITCDAQSDLYPLVAFVIDILDFF
ncbi:MAG: SBBP repeat-containing protein [Thermodesulfobacteriota bacterium]|nr:SBBP repeat-containing protein [Thermodesulfobacteriota bacterium]